MKKILFISFIAIILLLFFIFGRSIYMPVLHKIKGKETVESITQKIEGSVYNRLQPAFKQAGFNTFPNEIVMLAFKEEQILEVYAKQNDDFKLIKSYPFTSYSGELGPKLKEGDRQIPEGIYGVDYLNPNSSYYLSIKINYPNQFDQSKTKLSSVEEMGDNIFIHGKAATIGCIPIGDEAIEEVFLLASKATNKKIKVIISPRDFRKNPNYPNIESINWENELYTKIEEELRQLPRLN